MVDINFFAWSLSVVKVVLAIGDFVKEKELWMEGKSEWSRWRGLNADVGVCCCTDNNNNNNSIMVKKGFVCWCW